MYLPFLRGKKSERQAANSLTSEAKRLCSPVVRVLVPSEKDRSTVTPAMVWAGFCHEFQNFSFLVDRETAGLIQTLLGEIVPSATFRIATSYDNLEYTFATVEDCHREFGRGALILLSASQCKKPEVHHRLRRIADSMPLQIAVVEGEIRQNPEHLADFLAYSMEGLTRAGFSNIVFAGGSYPIDNGDLAKDEVTMVSRLEWQVYQKLLEAIPTLSFGDFASICPTDSKPFAAGAQLQSPAIRYATNTAWAVHRGVPTEADEWQKAMNKLAFELRGCNYFKGPKFSWGDKRIFEMALDVLEAPGRDWQAIRAIEINHHLTLVSRQVARLFESADTPVTPQATEE